jgi:hypothetical protein
MRYIVSLFLLSVMPLFAQSFHTINIDGNNDFDLTNEKLQTTGTNISSYITWDKDYLYIAYSGNTNSGTLTDANRVIHIYIDSDPMKDPTQGTGTRYGENWRFQPYLPFSANYHYVFKTIDNTEYKTQYVSGSWAPVSFSTSNWKGSGYWELRIKRSDLGNPAQIYIAAYIEEDWDGGYIDGGIPSNLFTPGTTGGLINCNNHWLNYYLIDQIKSNASFHKDNYQWMLRLNTSTSALKDTTTYAGFAINASDSLDSGTDLPNPPVPPSNYLDVYFPHTNWTSHLGPNYCRDIKKYIDLTTASKTWGFSVNTDQSNTQVTVKLDQYTYLPASYSIFVYDYANDSLHNVRTKGDYVYNSGAAGARNFDLLIGNITSAPSIYVTPDTLNFGSIASGSSKMLNLQIKNTGDSTLLISNIVSSNSAFTFTGGTSHSIKKDSILFLPVTFRPVSALSYSGTLTITNNDSRNNNYVVTLKGSGLNKFPKISLSTSALNFGSIFVDKDTTLKCKIYNIGDTTLTISNIISGNTVYKINGAVSRSILKNDSSEVSITFSPKTAADYSSTVHFLSNDPSHPDTLISVTGTGISDTFVKKFTPGWSLMSIPVTPSNASTGSIIGDDITSFYAFTYSGNSGYYATDSMFIGHGYWLGIEDTANVDITGLPAIANVNCKLTPGWNITATPFIRTYGVNNIYFKRGAKVVNADSAASLGWIQKHFTGYNTAAKSYFAADTLKQWAGYWMPVLTDSLEMNFYYDSTFGGPLKTNDIKTNSISNWFVNVSASIDNSSDNMLQFGVNSNATDDFDAKYDLAKAPVSPSPDALETYFMHNNWSSLFTKYQSDIKAAFTAPQTGKSWQFRMFSKKAGNLILTWNNILSEIPEEIRNNFNFYLTSPSIPGAVNMLSSVSCSMQAAANSEYIFNINASPTGISDNGNKVYSFDLMQNYPNPFNPSTSISYSLPKDGMVKLEVFNMLGQKVGTLVQDYQRAGNHEVRFDASGLSSGAYYYRITTNGNSLTRKMILMK